VTWSGGSGGGWLAGASERGLSVGLGGYRGRVGAERAWRELGKVLSEPAVSVLVVGHRDGLARLGVE
jgi:hypothetical protein